MDNDEDTLDPPPDGPDPVQGILGEWLTWFRCSGLFQTIAYHAMKEAVAFGIRSGVVIVSYDKGSFLVRLPKEWIEAQVRKRAP